MSIKKFLKDWSNICAFSLGLIPTVLLYVFPPTVMVPYFAFILILFLFLLCLWLCIKLYLDLKDQKNVIKQQILKLEEYKTAINECRITPTLPIIECHHNVCICKPNNLISNNSLVTFYEKVRGYEQSIGYGCVENINSANLAQIKVYSTSDGIPDLINHINNNMDNIVLRPTITLDTISKISLYL